MPLPKRTHCKLCANPVHVYPSGVAAAYCDEHLKFRKGKKRGNQPRITGPMQVVMDCLKASRDAGYPFAALPLVTDHRTITALIARDWIVESRGLDGLRYKITGRGLAALGHYESIMNRRDGICPRCGVRKRGVTKNGRRIAYCDECERERCRQKHHRLGRSINPERGCSKCGKPLHRYTTGSYSTYCTECEAERSRLKAHRDRETGRQIAHGNGDVPLCTRCKQKPVKLFANSISSYCAECLPLIMRKAKLRRKLKSLCPS